MNRNLGPLCPPSDDEEGANDRGLLHAGVPQDPGDDAVATVIESCDDVYNALHRQARKLCIRRTDKTQHRIARSPSPPRIVLPDTFQPETPRREQELSFDEQPSPTRAKRKRPVMIPLDTTTTTSKLQLVPTTGSLLRRPSYSPLQEEDDNEDFFEFDAAAVEAQTPFADISSSSDETNDGCDFAAGAQGPAPPNNRGGDPGEPEDTGSIRCRICAYDLQDARVRYRVKQIIKYMESLVVDHDLQALMQAMVRYWNAKVRKDFNTGIIYDIDVEYHVSNCITEGVIYHTVNIRNSRKMMALAMSSMIQEGKINPVSAKVHTQYMQISLSCIKMRDALLRKTA